MKDLLAHESIDENLRFLILEVSKQLERTREYVRRSSPKLLDNVIARDDYIDNLKGMIQRKVLGFAAEFSHESPASVHLLKSVDVVTVNLERIADFCGNIVRQLGYIENERVLSKVDFEAFFEEVIGGMSRIEHALFNRDIQESIQICRAEGILDRMYVRVFRELLQELKNGRDAQSLVTIIFISHYFERMGDSLLNIGEAILSACLGEPIKIGQFLALEDSLRAADMDEPVDQLSVQAIMGSRSGHRIARVSARPDSESSRMVIFKEGRADKLREEKESIARWEELVEGIAPKIYSFHERGETGAILFEYLPGKTLEEVLLQGEVRELDTVVSRIFQTVESVWRKTRRSESVRPQFLRQLSRRLEDLYAVHPDFRDEGRAIGPIKVQSFEELLEQARPLDEHLLAPFSVLVHGDFNIDNIIYDPLKDRMRFIDLHRSSHGDYVQDVSVFLVSNFRLQVFKAPVRRRINRAISRFYAMAGRFAEQEGDRTFSARLALGLARSLATSTRFVLDPSFAKLMMLKARYLLERLAACEPEQLESFTIPGDMLLD